MRKLSLSRLTVDEWAAMTVDQWATMLLDPDQSSWLVTVEDMWQAGGKYSDSYNAGAQHTQLTGDN